MAQFDFAPRLHAYVCRACGFAVPAPRRADPERMVLFRERQEQAHKVCRRRWPAERVRVLDRGVPLRRAVFVLGFHGAPTLQAAARM